MHCPYCQKSEFLSQKGSFKRKTGPMGCLKRFFCRGCGRFFSELTGTLTAGQRRPDLNQQIYHLLVSGVSQRKAARLLGTTQRTVAKKMVRMAAFAKPYLEAMNRSLAGTVPVAVFDEMETFEHSKLKPLSIAIAVEEKTRRIIAVSVASMPAKGRLAAAARRRYGYRPDHRRRGLERVLKEVQIIRKHPHFIIKSDECPRYPRPVREILPGAIHLAYKGRRGGVVGQGELKRGGFDPLFALNHTCAMNRDNIKRLSRRTWCTTKRPDRLQCLLYLYACAHNEDVASKEHNGRRAPRRFLDQVLPVTRSEDVGAKEERSDV